MAIEAFAVIVPELPPPVVVSVLEPFPISVDPEICSTPIVDPWAKVYSANTEPISPEPLLVVDVFFNPAIVDADVS